MTIAKVAICGERPFYNYTDHATINSSKINASFI